MEGPIARLRGGGEEATASGGEEVAEKEGSAGAESAEAMEVQQERKGRGDEEQGDAGEGDEKDDDGRNGEAEEKADAPGKKWNVECNGVAAEMTLIQSRCIFRCLCAACSQLLPSQRTEMSPNEFELHAGSRSKKWRTSIRAVLSEAEGGLRVPVGKVLEDEGLGRRPSNFVVEEGEQNKGGDAPAGEPPKSANKVRPKLKRPASSARPPEDEPLAVRHPPPLPDTFRTSQPPHSELPRLFGRTIYEQAPNGVGPTLSIGRQSDPPPRSTPPESGRTVSSGRVAVDVELVELGRLVTRPGWWDERSIYPAGYRSAVSFYSTHDVTRKCLFFQEIVEHWDTTVQPGPIFKVIAEDRRQTPFMGSSPDECWAEIQALVNNGLRQLRQEHPVSSAAYKNLPLAVADVSGLDMFGLTDPSIVRIVESLDPFHHCREYWLRRQGLVLGESGRAMDVGAAAGLGRDERLLRSLFDKGSMEELQALARVFTTLGGTGGLERVYRAALDVLERRIS